MVFTIHFFPMSEKEFTVTHPHQAGVSFTVKVAAVSIEPKPDCFSESDQFWELSIRCLYCREICRIPYHRYCIACLPLFIYCCLQC
jgi:hypothetical protein